MTDHDNDLTPNEAARWELLVDRFEEAWERGQRPTVEAFLPPVRAEQRAVLVLLVHVDLERRLKAGEPARVEDYLTRFPELADDRAAVVDLISCEYLLRRRSRPGLALQEYLDRFPDYQTDLIRYVRDTGRVAGEPETSPPESGSLPERAAGAGSLRWAALETPPPAFRSVPGYEILGELGRGGMGVVYKARHGPLQRLVALKMIRAGAHASREELARFRTEAEAVARMQHPHVVQIHEIGEHDGLPYLALEYLAGGSLAQKINGTPLPAPQAAGIVRCLAEAMHAAHWRAILHRDLKPANVLLTEDGTPKITDFGLAKKLDDAGQTTSGAVIGTPSYMAPEQAEGKTNQVGPPADVYALGAILYELLTGRPPFKGATSLDTVWEVLHVEPVPPRRLQPKVPVDLETICLKCLRKEPAKRYASADALANDLRRFLKGEPIQARPVGAWERGVKWARRRPASAALVGTAALLLLGAVAGGLGYVQWEHDRANQERALRQEAKTQEAQAQREKEKAEQSEVRARAVLSFFQDKVLAAARPEDMEGGLGRDATIRAALDAAEPEIAEAFADQPILEAAIRDTLGQSYRYLGEPALAIRQHERSLALRRQALGPDDPGTLESLNNLGVAYVDAGRARDAVPLLEEALKGHQALRGPDHPDTLQGMNNLALAYQNAGRLAEALPLLEEALAKRKALRGPDHPDTLQSLNNLAAAYREADRLADALPLYEEALKGSEVRLGPDHPLTLRTMNNLALAYRGEGRLDDAVPLFKQTLKGQEARLGPNHPDTLKTMNNLALAYRDKGRLDDALPLFEETLKRQRSRANPHRLSTLTYMNNLATAYKAKGRLNDALPLLEDVLKGLTSEFGADNPHTLSSMGNLGAAYLAAKRPEKALPLLDAFLAAQRKHLGPDSPRLAGMVVSVGLDLVRHEHFAEAEKILRESLAIQEVQRPDDWITFATKAALGASLRGQQQYTEAEALLRQGYEGMKQRAAKSPPNGKPRLSEVLEWLVQLYDAWGQPEQAAAWRTKLEQAKTSSEEMAK